MGKGKWREAKRCRPLQTAIQPGVMPTPPPFARTTLLSEQQEVLLPHFPGLSFCGCFWFVIVRADALVSVTWGWGWYFGDADHCPATCRRMSGVQARRWTRS